MSKHEHDDLVIRSGRHFESVVFPAAARERDQAEDRESPKALGHRSADEDLLRVRIEEFVQPAATNRRRKR